MRMTMAGGWLLLFFSVTVAGQNATGSARFEVASVRRSTDSNPGGVRSGGPGSADPTHIRYLKTLVEFIVQLAYAPALDPNSDWPSGLGFDQIVGPDWMLSEKYDIVANVPPGATRRQVQEMWRNLLADRFHLTLHHVTKEFPGYELLVAKGGSKLKKSTDDNLPQKAAQTGVTLSNKDGFLIVPPGRHYAQGQTRTGGTRLTFRDSGLSELADRLRWPLSTVAGGNGIALGRVEDNTGLTGTYDFTLKFSGVMGPGGAFSSPPLDGQDDAQGGDGPGLFTALETQLGLRLERKRISLDVLVIDHIERIPTEN